MPRAHDRLCPHRGSPRFKRSPPLSSSYRNRLARITPQPDTPPAIGPEDFTTYTSLDPNGRFTITPQILTIAALDRDETARLFIDKGANYFGPTWQHTLKTVCDNSPGQTQGLSLAATWSISNTISDLYTWDVGNHQAITLHWYQDITTIHLYFRDWKSASYDWHTYGTSQIIFTAYPTLQRTSETNAQCRIYTDAARTILLDTLNISVTSGDRHRYLFAANSYDSGHADREFFGTCEDLQL